MQFIRNKLLYCGVLIMNEASLFHSISNCYTSVKNYAILLTIMFAWYMPPACF